MTRALAPRALPAGGDRSPRLGTRLRGAVATARPRHWVKNVLVFAAPGAAGVLGQAGPLSRAGLAFVVFCAVSAGTYFANDALDAEADRAHPVKRGRPVASGVISPAAALAAAAVLVAFGIGLAATVVSWRLAVVVAVYVAVQVAYNLRLKHLPVWDLSCVASGFVIRAVAGGVAARVPVSQWFLIVATFGSLLMVTGKRLAEQLELGSEGAAHRRTLRQYSAGFLRTVLAISCGGTMLGYCLWAFDLQTAHRHHADPIWFELSIVPMLVAVLRYTFLVEQGQGARPERLAFSDRSLQVLGVAWLALFTTGVYAH
ncbi:MAG: decaprenyl-phosphate phosphoribosyltransferase [Acidimicrobiales bacterium]